MTLVERLRTQARRTRSGYSELPRDACAELDEAAEHIEALEAAVVALADGADKCAEAPHFIVQPFLAIYKKHGETIAEARAAVSSEPKQEQGE